MNNIPIQAVDELANSLALPRTIGDENIRHIFSKLIEHLSLEEAVLHLLTLPGLSDDSMGQFLSTDKRAQLSLILSELGNNIVQSGERGPVSVRLANSIKYMKEEV